MVEVIDADFPGNSGCGENPVGRNDAKVSEAAVPAAEAGEETTVGRVKFHSCKGGSSNRFFIVFLLSAFCLSKDSLGGFWMAWVNYSLGCNVNCYVDITNYFFIIYILN